MKVWGHDGSKQRPSSIAHILHMHKPSKCCSCSYHNCPRCRQQLVLAHHLKSAGVSTKFSGVLLFVCVNPFWYRMTNSWSTNVFGNVNRGLYYWKRASRKEQIKVKMVVAEDGTLSEIIVQGDDQQVEQMRKDLQLSEKGMVYVKGLFERS